MAQESVLIMLHGLGDEASYWEPFEAALQLLGSAGEGIKCIKLEAPMRTVWGDEMQAWFQYFTDHSGEDKEDDINEGHLKETRDRLHALIKKEAAKITGGSSRVLLVGSSQGGSAALDAALTLAEPLAGVAMLRSLPLGASMKAAVDPEGGRGMTPVLAVSGEEDDTFILPLVKKQLRQLEKLVEATHEVIPDLEHDTDYDVREMEFFLHFVSSQLGLGSTDSVTPEALEKIVDEDEEEVPIQEKSWGDLTEKQRKLAKGMGIHGADAWDNGSAAVWSKSWRKLSHEQRKAAARLGYTKTTWNGSD